MSSVHSPAGVDASLPARGVWIEIDKDYGFSVPGKMSLPARGVWIEIELDQIMERLVTDVTPREGSVD